MTDSDQPEHHTRLPDPPQLHEARALLESMTQGAGILIAAVDRELRYTFFNQEHHHELQRLTGKASRIGMPLTEVWADMAEGEEVLTLWSRALQGETVVRVMELGAPQGYRRWYSTRHAPIRDAGGAVVGAGEVAIDATEPMAIQQQALQASEGKYRTLFMNMAEEVHFWQLVRDGAGNIRTWRLVDANPPALRTWGRRSVAEIRGRTTDEIFGPGATAHYLPVVEKIMAEGVPYSFEDYFTHLDKHFRFTSVPLGEYFITTGADISDIKQAERVLQESEARLKRTQEIAHLGSWELNLVTGRLAWSDEVYRIFGLEPQEFAASYQAFLDRVHPDDRAAVDAAYTESVRDGLDAYEIEHRLIRRDTGEIRHVHEKCQHQRDDQGRIILSIGMVLDITERKTAEAELSRRENELRLVMNTVPALIAYIGPDLRYVRVNERYLRWFGRSSQELEGRPVREVVGEAAWKQVSPHLKRALRGETVTYEEVMPHWSGENRWVAAALVPNRDLAGRVRGLVAHVTDITERKLAEEQIRQQTEELRTTNAELEHFNNLMVGRELRMIELKKEVDQLCRQIGQLPRYGCPSD